MAFLTSPLLPLKLQRTPLTSLRPIHTIYDNAGRLSSFTGTLGDGVSRTYANQISYWAGGQMKKERFGTNTALYHNRHYNSRLQLVDIRLGTSSTDEWNWNRGALIFYHSATAAQNGNPFENNSDNNGNVIQAMHYVPLNDAITSSYLGQRDYYTYDALNRIQDVDEWQQNSSGAWSHPLYQKFAYDRWGNRTIDTGASFGYANKAFTVDTANNRLGKPGGSTCTGTKSGMCFDAAGNLTYDDYSTGAGIGERTYDAEGRMLTAANGAHSYTYDAGGRRTRRKVSGVETWQIYGLGNELIAEYAYNAAPASPQKEYGYRSGRLLVVAEGSNNVKWMVDDHLGTPRGVVGLGGGLGDVTRHDYLPFGEESSGVGIRSYGMDNVRQKFAGKERDSESELDYFGARYYSGAQGRFTSTDPVNFTGYRPANPQAWNRYSYVANTPVKFTDPSGKVIQFRNEEDAKKVVALFQGGLPKEQRSAVGYEKDKKGNFVLKIDQNAAGKAGQDSLLGRLSRAAAHERVAVVDFVKRDTKFEVIKFGVASSKEATTLAQEESKGRSIAAGSLSGITLPEFGDAPNERLFNTAGFNSAEMGKTRILINTESKAFSLSQAIYAETLAHFQTFAETGDARKAVHPRVDNDERQVIDKVAQNEKQK